MGTDILTTTAGWFPKPVAVRRARWRFAEGEIEQPELARIEDEATRAAIELQARLGLDLAVDGQMDRGDSVGFFAERVEGIETGGLVRCFGNRYYRRPRIVDAVQRSGAITVDRWRAAQAISATPVKAVLTGPYTLMDWSYDEHYDSREDCCLALADVIREEAEALRAAGATEIQIDEPAISARYDEMELAAGALGHVTRALRGQARTWAHLYYGDLAPVIRDVFALPVDGLMLEMVNSEYSLLDALGAFPEDRLIAAGVIDVLSQEVEDVAVVASRIRDLLGRVAADRLWVMPDTGLRTLRPEVAEAKLRVMVAAAASCR